MISRTFIAAVKLSPHRSYQIAHQASLHPSTLSKIVNGIERVQSNDPRVISVANVLGLNHAECFEDGK